MCRDGYRADCAFEGCTAQVSCRDYTLCAEHRVGTLEDWGSDDWVMSTYRCRVCKKEVTHTQFANEKMVELELCYEHWKNMI